MLKPQKPKMRPPIITIFGDAGTGKNSLATAVCESLKAPAIMIRCENGAHRQTQLLDLPDTLSSAVCQSQEDILEQINWLRTEDHDYKAVILDSASAADEIFSKEVIETGGKNGGKAPSLAAACGGYGNGYSAVVNKHATITKWLKRLSDERSMMIIYIVHADLETMKLPDMDDYQRWSLRITSSKNASALRYYVDDVDAVVHVRLASALTGDDEKRRKIVSKGEREIVCHATAASVTKNGWGITEPLEFEEGSNPLKEYMLRSLRKPKADAEPKVEAEPATENEVLEEGVE